MATLISAALMVGSFGVASTGPAMPPPDEPPPPTSPVPATPVVPATTTAPPAPPPEERACSSKGGWGTKPHVTRIGQHIAARYSVASSKIGGYRRAAIDRQGHPAGLALDFTVNRAIGDRIAAYLLTNRERFGVRYVIWRQRLNYGSGWKPMADRGGATANHYDHVHVSFSATPSGAAIAC